MKRAFAWVSFITYIIGVAAMIVLSEELLKDGAALAFTAAFAPFPAVGLVIVVKRPENPLGWVFCVVGLLAGAGGFSWSYTEYSYLIADRPLPLAVWAAWAGSWLWYPLLASIVVLPALLFPDGLLSSRWRPVLWTAVVLVAAVSLVAATPDMIVAGEIEQGEELIRLENPLGLWDNEGRVVDDHPLLQTAWFGLLALILAGVVSLILRFRRSRGRERLQMKWFTFAALVMLVNMILGSIVPSFNVSFLSEAMFVIAIAALPVTCGIAIVKHQLYEIDMIINRTLVYAVLTAVLVLAYLSMVFVLQQILSGFTRDSDIAVAGSTLAVAAMFRPLRVRVQGFIDRRFYRRKYDAQHTLDSFSSRLRDEVDLEHLARDLSGVVRETMQPAHLSVWLRVGRS